MPTTLADLATLVGGRLNGADSAPDIVISGVAILDVAVAGELTLVDHADRAPFTRHAPDNESALAPRLGLAQPQNWVPTWRCIPGPRSAMT
jgi:hypothetical protein